MSRTHRTLVLFACAAAVSTAATASSPILDAEKISITSTIEARSLQNLPVNCGAGQIMLSAVATPHDERSVRILANQGLTAGGSVVPMVDGVYAASVGTRVTAQNISDEAKAFSTEILCGRLAAGYGASTSVGVVNIAAGQRGKARAHCPGLSIALGGGHDGFYVIGLGYYPFFRNTPTELEDRSDGLYSDAPGGWSFEAYNPGTTDRPASAVANCVDTFADAKSWVGSVSLVPGDRRFVGLAVPDDYRIWGGGLDPGTEGYVWGTTNWNVGFGFHYTRQARTPHTSGGIYGGFVQDLRPSGSMLPATAIKGAVVVTTGESRAATSVVSNIEYYNTGLTHWFTTSLQPEQHDLDLNIHIGWGRTGFSFPSYATGSGGPVGRFPFARFYSSILNSHFYTASPVETLDVLAKFGNTWGIESGEVGQIQVPNVYTGECPAGTQAIYRTWNRRDNHRWLTDWPMTGQMIASGQHVLEGYGPWGVVACAPSP